MPNRVISFEPPTYSGLFRVTSRLRASDKRECFATRFHDDPAELAIEIDGYSRLGVSWLVCVNQEPVASLGALPIWPGHWNVWAFGTERWGQVVMAMTKHIKRVLIPLLVQMGANSVAAYVHAVHTEACTWLEFLGAVATPLPKWGKSGEDFILYRWFRETTLQGQANG
jgi:hypothetical protein